MRDRKTSTGLVWRPRGCTNESALGAVTGAQAMIYCRARDVLIRSQPLLDSLRSWHVDPDRDDIDPLREIVHSQLDEFVSELSRQSGPRIARAELVLDLLQQALWQVRNRLGSATVEEEQSLTDFLVLEDYVAGLRRTWNLERPALERAQRRRAKELAQLAPVVRMLAVVAGAADEAASALGAAIDPVELLTTTIGDSSLSLADLFSWIDGFASSEGPHLIADGGREGVEIALLPTAKLLHDLVQTALAAGHGCGNPRVETSWRELLRALEKVHGSRVR